MTGVGRLVRDYNAAGCADGAGAETITQILGLVKATRNFGLQLTCSICHSLYKEPYTTRCLHTYCRDCLFKSLSLKEACPLCKVRCRKREARPDEKLERILKLFRQFQAGGETGDLSSEEIALANASPSRKGKSPVGMDATQAESLSQLALGFGMDPNRMFPQNRPVEDVYLMNPKQLAALREKKVRSMKRVLEASDEDSDSASEHGHNEEHDRNSQGAKQHGRRWQQQQQEQQQSVPLPPMDEDEEEMEEEEKRDSLSPYSRLCPISRSLVNPASQSPSQSRCTPEETSNLERANNEQSDDLEEKVETPTPGQAFRQQGQRQSSDEQLSVARSTRKSVEWQESSLVTPYSGNSRRASNVDTPATLVLSSSSTGSSDRPQSLSSKPAESSIGKSNFRSFESSNEESPALNDSKRASLGSVGSATKHVAPCRLDLEDTPLKDRGHTEQGPVSADHDDDVRSMAFSTSTARAATGQEEQLSGTTSIKSPTLTVQPGKSELLCEDEQTNTKDARSSAAGGAHQEEGAGVHKRQADHIEDENNHSGKNHNKEKSESPARKVRLMSKTNEHEVSHQIEQPENTAGGERQNQTKDSFAIGESVTVARRMGPGVNKPGGAARICKIHPDGTFDVKYTLGGGEKKVASEFMQRGIAIASSSFFGGSVYSPIEKKSSSSPCDDTLTYGRDGRSTRTSKKRDFYTPPLGSIKCLKAVRLPSKTDKLAIVAKANAELKADKELPKYRRATMEATKRRMSDSHRESVKSLKRRASNSPAPKDMESESTQTTANKKRKRKEAGSKEGKRAGTSKKPLSVDQHPKVLFTGSFAGDTRENFMVEVAKLGGTVEEAEHDRATHIVVFASRKGDKFIAKRTLKYLRAICQGKWLVHQKWIRDSVKQGSWLAEEAYEVDGDIKSYKIDSGGPRRARLATAQATKDGKHNNNGLLTGVKVFLMGFFNPETVSKTRIREMIELCGGINLKSFSMLDAALANDGNGDKVVVLCSDAQSARQDPEYARIMRLFREGKLKDALSLSWLLNSFSVFKLVQKEDQYRVSMLEDK